MLLLRGERLKLIAMSVRLRRTKDGLIVENGTFGGLAGTLHGLTWPSAGQTVSPVLVWVAALDLLVRWSPFVSGGVVTGLMAAPPSTTLLRASFVAA